ncbi:MAG: histidine kinase [Bacteroidota bacterium]
MITLLKHTFLCFLLCYLPFTGWADSGSTPHIQLIWVEEDIVPEEALHKFSQSDGLITFDQTRQDSSRQLYDLHLKGVGTKYNPGAYWAKISFSPAVFESCICFGFWRNDSIDRFSQVILYQLLGDSVHDEIAPLWTGGEVNKQDKSLWYSKTCMSTKELAQIDSDSLTILVKLFRFRNYEDNIVIYFSTPEDEIKNRNIHIATYFSHFAFIIAFCAILFFSFLYFLMQYAQSAQTNSSRKEAYLWYCLFLMLMCFYHVEHLDWDSNIYGWMSHIVAWHYYYEVPLVTAIYFAYLNFFKHFFQFQSGIASIVYNRSIQFVLCFPFIDVGLREIWGVHVAMTAYDIYRITFYLIIIFIFYSVYPTFLNQASTEEKKEAKLKRLIFWGCLSLIFGSILTISFKIPLLKEMKHEWGISFGQELNFTCAGILIENLFFIAAFAYKQRMEIEEQEQLKQEKRDAMRMLGDIKYQLTRSRVAQHSLTKIIDVIETDKSREKDLIHKLHAFVRKQYENSMVENISLAEEIQQIRTYLELQQLRMPDLQYEIDTIAFGNTKNFDPSFFRVPPSFLFPYIENAVDHGLFPKLEGMRVIKITVEEKEHEQLWYTIEDTGIGIHFLQGSSSKRTGEKSTGTMLSEDYLRSHDYRHRITQLTDGPLIRGTRVEIFPFNPTAE